MLKPVSYTQRDVYKRQMLHCTGVEAGSRSVALTPMERRGLCQSQFSRSNRIAASCSVEARQVGDSSLS